MFALVRTNLTSKVRNFSIYSNPFEGLRNRTIKNGKNTASRKNDHTRGYNWREKNRTNTCLSSYENAYMYTASNGVLISGATYQ
jgi:hypothetical protein